MTIKLPLNINNNKHLALQNVFCINYHALLLTKEVSCLYLSLLVMMWPTAARNV